MVNIHFSYGIGVDRETIMSVEVEDPVIPRIGEVFEFKPHRGPDRVGTVKAVSYTLDETKENVVNLHVHIWIVP